MMAKTMARFVAATVLAALLLGCKGEGDSKGGSGFGVPPPAPPVATAPPAISGSPKTSVVAGQQYQFVPTAADPAGGKLAFEVVNKPKWAAFDAATGALAGKPATADVGKYSGVTITASNGKAKASLPTFEIDVMPSSSPTPSPQPKPVPLPSAGSKFEFTEIPEIVFVRGYPETEHMGIFQLDTQNRWTPGDLTNESGWMPRIATQLNVVSGAVSGVSYDSKTGVLSYDGSGSGSETATVYLAASSEGAQSQQFNIRVLAPTIAWGVDADKRFPGIGYDSKTTPWLEMQREMKPQAPYDQPNVLLITAGDYTDNYSTAGDKLNLYLLGEPGKRPIIRGDSLGLIKLQTAYLKNLELWDTIVDGGAYLTDRPVNVYVTKVYQHDSTREQSGFGSPAYEGDSRFGAVVPPGEWRHWVWNFHGSQMGGTGNTKHQFYLEGRPNTYALFNNIRVTGTRGCSAIKSTRWDIRVRNSYLSTLLDPTKPEIGRRADKLIDIASAAQAVIYNNAFIGAWSKDYGGIGTAMVYFRARRDWWGSDSPAYPDVSWSPPVTSVAGGGYLAPKGFTAGPETFVNPEFWKAVRSWDISDPKNPYSYQKHVSYNSYKWIEEGAPRRAAVREDGTAPRTAAAMFSSTEYWGTVPENWAERAVVFVANNAYEGWSAEDTQNPERWFSMQADTPESLITKVGPGPWAYPTPPRTLVKVGGETGPEGQSTPIELPVWFRK
jgi:hypothetical protein